MAEVRENLRRMTYEVAEAVAPGWERRRASIEEVAAPVRNWMIEALAPSEGDTVLELACDGLVGEGSVEAVPAEGRRRRCYLLRDHGRGHMKVVPVRDSATAPARGSAQTT